MGKKEAFHVFLLGGLQGLGVGVGVENLHPSIWKGAQAEQSGNTEAPRAAAALMSWLLL